MAPPGSAMRWRDPVFLGIQDAADGGDKRDAQTGSGDESEWRHWISSETGQAYGSTPLVGRILRIGDGIEMARMPTPCL